MGSHPPFVLSALLDTIAEIPDLTPAQRWVATCLARFTDWRSGKAWPSQQTLARVAAVTDDTVRAALAALANAGVIALYGRTAAGSAQWQWAQPSGATPPTNSACPASAPPEILGTISSSKKEPNNQYSSVATNHLPCLDEGKEEREDDQDPRLAVVHACGATMRIRSGSLAAEWLQVLDLAGLSSPEKTRGALAWLRSQGIELRGKLPSALRQAIPRIEAHRTERAAQAQAQADAIAAHAKQERRAQLVSEALAHLRRNGATADEVADTGVAGQIRHAADNDQPAAAVLVAGETGLERLRAQRVLSATARRVGTTWSTTPASLRGEAYALARAIVRGEAKDAGADPHAELKAVLGTKPPAHISAEDLVHVALLGAVPAAVEQRARAPEGRGFAGRLVDAFRPRGASSLVSA